MKNSKTGSGRIKTFFLYNIEKLILVASLICLGLFFYLGMSSEKFEKSPDNLVSEANQATSYIESASNWDEIAMHRQGDVAVVDRVKSASAPVEASNYKVPGLSMVPKALQLRLDPPLPKVQDVEAHVLRASVIVQNKQKNREDPILKLPLARAKADPDAKGRTPMMGSMGPSEDDMDDMMEDYSYGGPPARSDRNKKKKKVEKDPQEDAEVDAWWGLPGVQEILAGGVRPKTVAAAGSDIALTRNIVVVNALIDHKNLWKQHEQTLSSSLGYYPKRDLPRYDFLQVERRVVKDGQPGEWSDISTFVNFEQANFYPSSFTSAPEVVPAENYDQYLTNAIPPILGMDYASAVLHSKLARRVFKVPEDENKGVATADILDGKEELETNERPMVNQLGEGVRRQKKGLGGRGGGGYGGMGGGYGGDMGGGYGDEMMGGGYGGYGMRTGDGRSSSDLREYEELADPVLEPTADFKQVRFFDMGVNPNKSAVYEYRMRVWVADPNNADENASTGMDDYGGPDMDGMMGMGGPGGMMGNKKDEKKIYKKTKIDFTMQDQSVRNRLKRAREEGPMGEKKYFVSEIYEGSDEAVEVPVPVGDEYLRFARPTPWSGTVRVAVGDASAEFYAKKIAQPRTARVGETEIPVEESKAELVTSVEDSQYQGARIAAMRLFAIGDLLNFTEPVTILHPVAQSIHFIEEANLRSDGVLIDVMGGNRLDVSRNEPIQYALPGETLIMDSEGKFIISNDIEDLTDARHALRLPDEKAEYGGKKAARRAKQEAAERMRGGGGYPGMDGM